MLETEKDVKKAVKDLLDKYKHHVMYFMPGATIYGKSGIHDFIICVEGIYLSVETKAPNVGRKGLTSLQKLFAEQIFRSGGLSFLVWNEQSLEMLDKQINHILQRTKRSSEYLCNIKFMYQRMPKFKEIDISIV